MLKRNRPQQHITTIPPNMPTLLTIAPELRNRIYFLTDSLVPTHFEHSQSDLFTYAEQCCASSGHPAAAAPSHSYTRHDSIVWICRN